MDEEPLSVPVYTLTDYESLTAEQQDALLRVAAYLGSEPADLSDDESLTLTLNILRPCDGCLPHEELGDDLLAAIRRKFACIYYPAVELAEEELKARGLRFFDDFAFCLEIDPSYEDATHVAVVDYRAETRPFCYLHLYEKAWHFSFLTLLEIAAAVTEARAAILTTFDRLCVKSTRRHNGEPTMPRRPRLLALTERDWAEIYYAVDLKLRHITSDAKKNRHDAVEPNLASWQHHLQQILRTLGPDGMRMHEAIAALREAAEHVVSSWESGDLQFAAQELDRALMPFRPTAGREKGLRKRHGDPPVSLTPHAD